MKKTKIVLSMVLVCIMLISSIAMADAEDKKNENVVIVFALGDSEYSVNGELLTMDVSPTVFESRTLLPIRYAAEPLGADIGWHQEDKRVIVSLGETVINLWIGEGNALVNGKTVPIDSDNPNIKPLVISGRTMLPLRFVAESLGCEVQWDPDSMRVAIIKIESSSDIKEIPDILKKPDLIRDIIKLPVNKSEIILPGKDKTPIPAKKPEPEYDILKIDDTAYYDDYYGTVLTYDTDLLKTPEATYKWGITNTKPMSLQYFAFYLKHDGEYEKFKASFYLDISAKAELVMTIRKDSRKGIVLKSLTLVPGETLKDVDRGIEGINKLYFESELRINHGSVEKIVVGEPVFYK